MGSEGTLCTASISLIASGIEQNARSGGKLQVLNLLENRLSSHGEQHCKCCLAAFQQTWENEPEGDGRLGLLRRRHFMNSHECKNCKGSPEVTDLIKAVADHPVLSTLLGIMPGARHVELNSLRCCDQHMRLLEAELQRSHTIESIDVSNNCITRRGLEILLSAVGQSLALSSLRLPLDELHVEGMHSPTLKLEVATKKSFRYRIALAVFTRGLSHIGALPCRLILEFAIGPGPLVDRFLRHRFVCSEWQRPAAAPVDEEVSGVRRKRKVKFFPEKNAADRPLESPNPVSEESGEPDAGGGGGSGKQTRRRLTYQT